MSNTNNPTPTPTPNPKTLANIMNTIETAVNPKTAQEGLALLSKPDELVSRMQSGADYFKQQTGRNMTYSEMRQMYG